MKSFSNIILLLKAFKYYRFFRCSHLMSKEELRGYQFEQTRRILIYASKKVPYYRNLFRQIGFVPERDFLTLTDLERIPYTDKDTLRKYHDSFLSEDINLMDVEIDRTSGSTGSPLDIVLDQETRAAKYAMVYKIRHAAGYNLWDRAFSLWGVYAITKRKPFGVDWKKNIVYFANNKMSEENNASVGELLCKFKPVQFEGYARSFFELGSSLKRQGKPIWSPKSIFCYGDCLTDELRAGLSDIFQTKVIDFYSHAENIVVVSEFAPGIRYMMEDFFYPEIIASVEDPNCGELVGTGFYNYAMPLIRYKTKDIIELDATPSPEGLAFRRVKKIIGRQNDYLLMADGRKILSIQRAIYGYDQIVESQIIQTSFTDVELRLVVDGQFDLASVRLEIEDKMSSVCGVRVNLTLKIVSELEKLKSGKAPFIIRKFNNETSIN